MGSSATGYNFGLGSSSERGTSSSSSTTNPLWSEQAQRYINSIGETPIRDVNASTQGSLASIIANTQNELPGLMASAKSAGYGKATNWGQGNMASAAAQALGQRDVQLANVQQQADQFTAQQELAKQQNLLGLLSLMRGESADSTQVTSAKRNAKNFGFSQSFAG